VGEEGNKYRDGREGEEDKKVGEEERRNCKEMIG
jgi:hypothetical protein